ncbi:MAG: hypothetical protein CG445_1240, partial [Methanosaeta sp. ASM2]
GWSKNGIRIPVEKWSDFKAILDGADLKETEKRADESDQPAAKQD